MFDDAVQQYVKRTLKGKHVNKSPEMLVCSDRGGGGIIFAGPTVVLTNSVAKIISDYNAAQGSRVGVVAVNAV